MRTKLETMKDMEIINEPITIKSTLKTEQVDDIDNLVDGLWFELKTVDLDGEENTYHLQLEVIEITRANDNSPSAY